MSVVGLFQPSLHKKPGANLTVNPVQGLSHVQTLWNETCLIILSPALSYREEQSLAEEEQKEELEEPPIDDPGKGHTTLLRFILISSLLIVSSSQKITKADSLSSQDNVRSFKSQTFF